MANYTCNPFAFVPDCLAISQHVLEEEQPALACELLKEQNEGKLLREFPSQAGSWPTIQIHGFFPLPCFL
jgi:hypothetical protein